MEITEEEKKGTVVHLTYFMFQAEYIGMLYDICIAKIPKLANGGPPSPMFFLCSIFFPSYTTVIHVTELGDLISKMCLFSEYFF